MTISRVGKTMVGSIINKGITFFYDGLNYFKVKVPFEYVDVSSCEFSVFDSISRNFDFRFSRWMISEDSVDKSQLITCRPLAVT